MSYVNKKVNDLFSKANQMNSEDLKSNFNEILIDGEKSVLQYEEKVQLANNMHTLMTNYLRELDQDIHLCRIELEAHNSGICEKIEKRSLDSEPNGTTYQKEKKNNLNRCLFGNNAIVLKKNSSIIQKSTPRTSNCTINENVMSSSQQDTNLSMFQLVPPSFTQNMDSMEIDNTIILDTTCRDVITTEELSQDNKTAKPKISFALLNPKIAIKNKKSSNSIQLPLKLHVSEPLNDTNKTKKQKKDKKLENLIMPTKDEKTIEKNDVTEPCYCICNQVAFGVMVACDNKKCLHEWFHCECVGISDPPKGKWYCPRCLKNMKRRRSRRN